MIRDYEFYHGAALAKLIHSKQPISIRLFPTESNASYVVNEKSGLYLKYSSNRMSPWSFSFQKNHQDEIDEMKNKFRNVVIGLVCHDDGIVGLNYGELKTILDNRHEKVEWITVSRKPRHKYSVKGKDGKLHHKIGEKEFLEKLDLIR